MAAGRDAIESLRQAIAVSPENVPLRKHLAELLAQYGHYQEAENHLREALSLSPQDLDVKLQLAQVYNQQDKVGQAMVIVEDLVAREPTPAAAHLLYARLLVKEGNVERAVSQYHRAIDADPEIADEEFAERLGIVAEEDAGEVFEGRVRSGWGEEENAWSAEVIRPTIRFADVGGMDALKEEIGMKIIMPMKHPEMYKAYGKSAGGGILMYGPPGCGKTYLARATAGEIDANFISVGINDVLDMWLGQSEKKLHTLFEQARASAPCVLFFDEVDALGARRSDMQGGTARQLINQFLSEMDGVEHDNEGVMILAATNAPWHVDPAFRRPGRFDRVLFVPPPDEPSRAVVFELQCRDKPTDQLDFAHLAKKCADFSGADIKAVVDYAVEDKLREAFRTGQPVPLTNKDLVKAIKATTPSTREWFSTAKNYALYANDAGTYDEIKKYLKIR